MKLNKVIEMFKTLNLMTDSMGLYANVEIDEQNPDFCFDMETGGQLVRIYIHCLDKKYKKVITSDEQILIYAYAYQEFLQVIHETIILILSNYTMLNNFTSEGPLYRHYDKTYNDGVHKLQNCLNNCYRLKTNTIEMRAKLRNKKK